MSPTTTTAASEQRTRTTAIAAVLCAGIAVGSYISVPAGPVPFTLQTLFVLLTGLLLTPGWAAAAVAAYLLMGAAGLPVFSAGSGGIGHLLGPTGGYLWGFLPAAVAASLLRTGLQGFSSGNTSIIPDAVAAAAATLLIYAAGVVQLALIAGMGPLEALAAGMLPFLIGDAVKLFAAVLAAALMRPLLRRRGI